MTILSVNFIVSCVNFTPFPQALPQCSSRSLAVPGADFLTKDISLHLNSRTLRKIVDGAYFQRPAFHVCGLWGENGNPDGGSWSVGTRGGDPFFLPLLSPLELSGASHECEPPQPTELRPASTSQQPPAHVQDFVVRVGGRACPRGGLKTFRQEIPGFQVPYQGLWRRPGSRWGPFLGTPSPVGRRVARGGWERALESEHETQVGTHVSQV